MRKYTDEEMEILTRCYVDYKQLERLLYIEIGNTTDITKVYNFMVDLKRKDNRFGFTNVELDEGYFDFNYRDMLLTISTYNTRKICLLGNLICVYDDKNCCDLCEIDFDDLEKLIFNYVEFGK